MAERGLATCCSAELLEPAPNLQPHAVQPDSIEPMADITPLCRSVQRLCLHRKPALWTHAMSTSRAAREAMLAL